MAPRNVHAPGLSDEQNDGKRSPPYASRDGSVSSFRDPDDSPIDSRESNPWASEPHRGWGSTTVPQSKRRSTSKASRLHGYFAPEPSRDRSSSPRRERMLHPPRDRSTRRETRHDHERDWPSELSPSSSFDDESLGEGSADSANLTAEQAAALEQQTIADQIERLQKRLASLQQASHESRDAGHMGVHSKKWTIVHEVECLRSDRTTYHLDEPQLINDRDLGHLHWQGQRQITNIGSWIRRQKTPFVIYRRYRCIHQRDEPLDPDERLVVISDELDEALSAWFGMESGPSLYDRARTYAKRELYAPYVCFYHFQHEARQSLSDAGIPVWGASLLLEYLQTAIATVAQEAESVFASGRVTAEFMPYLFKPGSLVCFDHSGDLIACEQASVLKTTFEDSSLHRNSYECLATRVVFNGKFRRLDPSVRRFNVSFIGGQAINIEDLPVQPVAHITRERRLALERRGETFMRCEKQLYVTYPSEGGNHDFVDTRFMVDVEAYHILHREGPSESDEEGSILSERSLKRLRNTKDFQLQLPPTIQGFNMTEKKWIPLKVAAIKEVQWNPQTFQSVEIAEESKELIEALVRNKIERDEGLDFVQGKGTGLVVLLHGGPGTGKTLTAEGVAEIAKKPLFHVTGGDVGTAPETVERYLESVFYLGRRWNCVVLLDEADVFLEQRSLENLERNALVSVFLRVIEYYDGILILTSNRVGTFDEAFKSRIQLALHFDNLDTERRTKIWSKFIDRLAELDEGVDFKDVRSHLHDLAKQSMNGRQIRNAITTARQLARFRKDKLSYRHLKQAIDVSQRFENYIKDVKGGQDDDEIAEQDMLRARGR